MSTLTVQFPASLRRTIESFSEQEGYSVDQFLASAAAEKLAAMRTVDWLKQEAAKGRRVDFEQFMAAVPEGTLPETDRMPD